MKWMLRMVALYVLMLAVIATVALSFAATGRPASGLTDQPSHTANAVSHQAYEIHKMLAHTP